MPSRRCSPTRAIAALYWKFSRFTPVVDLAPTESSVVVGAPHTTNWDFVHMIMVAWKCQMPIRFIGKHTLFKGPAGPIMRKLGGIAVDRQNPAGLIDYVLGEITTAPKAIHIVIAPDGTRRANGPWKSGFYRIAREANLPVSLCFIDRTTMTCGFGPTLRLTSDIAADMDQIREFYADKAGNRPQYRREPRLAHE